MAIRKRVGKKGVSWQIDYLDPTGKRVRESFKKKKDAEAELGKRVSLIAEKRYLDVKKEYLSTFGELIERYTENFKHQRAFISKRCYFQGFKDHFGADKRLSDITYLAVESYQNRLRDKLTMIGGRLRKPSSINREMTILGGMFNKAVEWEMMEKSPFDKGKKLHLKENNERKLYLTKEQVVRLLSECHAPHVRRIVFCALNTGMRLKEILTLRWEQIRDGRIYIMESKTMDQGVIPLNRDMVAMLKEIRSEQGLSSEYVFTYQGKRVDSVKVGFKAACRRAGIKGFHFHDLRHTCASLLIQEGASLKVVQEILRHKNIRTTMRYAHLAEDQTANAVNLLCGLGTLGQNGYVTNPSHPEKQSCNPLEILTKI
jgi:integrase